MNAKRILTWEHYDDDNWTVETKIEDYHVNLRDYSTEPAVFYEASCGNEWPRCLGEFENPDAAIAACESDYIARCTEFLTLYDPATHIVVSRDSLRSLLDYWFGECPADKFAVACQGAAELRAALEVGK